MSFRILNINKKYNFFKSYFKSFGLSEILADRNFYKRSINEMNVKHAYEPELDDLYLLRFSNHKRSVLLRQLIIEDL